MNQSGRAVRCFAACAAIWLLPQIGSANPFSHRMPSVISNSEPSASDTVQDYSHSLPLSVSGKQGVVGFRLPQAVYLHARSAGLNDLRLFDAAGAAIPFALHVPPLQQHIQHRVLPVRVFPLTSDRDASSNDAIALDVRTAADGTLLSVKTRSGKKAAMPGEPATAPLSGLILDLGSPSHAGNIAGQPLIDALHFSLPATMTSYSAQVWLEVSDDLKQWDTIGAAELNWLVNRDTQTLANDRLEFEPRRFRYARLTWRGGEPVQFGAITAESVIRTGDAPVLDTLLLQPDAGKQPQDLVYHAGIAIPVEKIGLQFNEPNVVLPAAFGSYRTIPSRQPGQAKTWVFQPIVRTNFYQITQAGQQRRSGDISIPPTHLADWVVRPQIANTSKPALRLSWQPATLIFLASGNGPYTLAFGRDKVKSVRLDLSQVAPGFTEAELRHLEQAAAGPVQERQGLAQAEQGIGAAGIRKWSLWGALLLGVAVLGVMARRLIKQMA